MHGRTEHEIRGAIRSFCYDQKNRSWLHSWPCFWLCIWWQSTNRRGPGTHQCTAYPESQNFKLDLSFGPAIENPLFDSERHFSCKAPCGLQKCPPSTQTDSMQVLLKPKSSNVMEVRRTKCAQEIHINEDSPIKHTISIHSPSPSKKKQAPFNRSSIKENLDMKQTPSPSKHSSRKQSPFSPSSQRKRYQQDVSSQSPSCKTATKGCDASPTGQKRWLLWFINTSPVVVFSKDIVMEFLWRWDY